MNSFLVPDQLAAGMVLASTDGRLHVVDTAHEVGSGFTRVYVDVMTADGFPSHRYDRCLDATNPLVKIEVVSS